MKRIVIFSLGYYPLLVGGAEVAIKEITDRISPEDIQFTMITAKRRKEHSRFERIGNIDIYRVGLGFEFFDKFIWMPLFGCLKATLLHRKNKFDGVWAMMANQSGVSASLFKLWNKVLLVTTLQEGDEEEHLKRYVLGNDFLYKIFIRPWHIMPIRLADRVTAISNYLVERAKDSGAKGEVKLIPNGVDLEKFSKEFSEDMLKMGREKAGFSNDDILIFTSSRLVKKNGVADLISSLEFLPDSFKLLVAGDGEDREKLEKMIEKKRLTERAVILGFIEPDYMPYYLKMSDIFCRPSLSEGMGNSFIEAMASGVPVVATSVGGIKDFLVDGETGFVVLPENPKSIASGIERAYKNRDKVIKKAKEKAREYDWSDIAEDMKKVFEK